jgi:hypothetical protein
MMPRRDPEWYELEKTRKEEWKATWESWEKMGQETALSELGDMGADPHFSNDSAASNGDLQRESFHNGAFHPSGQSESSERTWPMSPQMLAVETATRELLELEEHIDLLQLPATSQGYLSRRISKVEMRTADAPRYVTLPIRERNPRAGPSLPTETHMLKLIKVEEGDSAIHDPPLQVVQG